MFKKKIKLPTSLLDYDALVATLVKRYKFPEPDHVSAVISVAIRHLPNDQAYTTLDYLAQCVQKSMANHVANHKGEMMKGKVQVDNMIDMLKQDPNNQQILDELKRFADQGFDYAKEALAKLDTTVATTTNNINTLQVVPNEQ